ncbi:MAG: hypothetical protein KTM48_02950, partial [Wolbachia endosymbiont of Pissodes strobi]|nr:hypothetical protein [Wolbachia endosymbiont of Pissodes strobi]
MQGTVQEELGAVVYVIKALEREGRFLLLTDSKMVVAMLQGAKAKQAAVNSFHCKVAKMRSEGKLVRVGWVSRTTGGMKEAHA